MSQLANALCGGQGFVEASVVPERRRRVFLSVLNAAQRLPLVRDSFTVGSTGNNDLMLDDPYVARRHCSFVWSGETLWLENEPHSSGTWVDGSRVDRCALNHDAQIVVGQTALAVEGLDHQPNPPGMIGEHATMRQLYQHLRRLAASDVPVVITGESGTGKELVARALHQASARHEAAFEAVNCAAIPREIAESELFGHMAGSFTGARQSHVGLFQRANGGTLLLDEVAEMPLDLQAKLLRVLEERSVRPIGSSRTTTVNARVIVATNRNLDEEVRRGRFRLDLYHRLAVGLLHVPSLRERRSDIPLLLEHFIAQLPSHCRPGAIGDDVISVLSACDWPGNVRALRNAILRATLNGGPVLAGWQFSFLPQAAPSEAPQGWIRVAGRTFAEIRREIYERALVEHRGNRSLAGQSLGIPKSTFCDQVRAMGL